MVIVCRPVALRLVNQVRGLRHAALLIPSKGGRNVGLPLGFGLGQCVGDLLDGDLELLEGYDPVGVNGAYGFVGAFDLEKTERRAIRLTSATSTVKPKVMRVEIFMSLRSVLNPLLVDVISRIAHTG